MTNSEKIKEILLDMMNRETNYIYRQILNTFLAYKIPTIQEFNAMVYNKNGFRNCFSLKTDSCYDRFLNREELLPFIEDLDNCYDDSRFFYRTPTYEKRPIYVVDDMLDKVYEGAIKTLFKRFEHIYLFGKEMFEDEDIEDDEAN